MTNIELMEFLEENGYEPSIENLSILRESSDVELMEFLEENGYEPSVENLSILREDGTPPDPSAESGPAASRIGFKDDEAKIENPAHFGIDGTRLSVTPKGLKAKFLAARLDHHNRRGEHHYNLALRRTNSAEGTSRADLTAKLQEPDMIKKIDPTDTTKFIEVPNERHGKRKKGTNLAKRNIDRVNVHQTKARDLSRRLATDHGVYRPAKVYKESFSDYELYQILDENGYSTTEENLSILKEGLDSGKYTFDLD